MGLEDVVCLVIDNSLTVLSTYRTRYKKLMASSFGAADAGWRRIQLFQSDVTTERLRGVDVKDTDPARGPAQVIFEFGHGATLGDVFERIIGIVFRTRKQSMAAAGDTVG